MAVFQSVLPAGCTAASERTAIVITVDGQPVETVEGARVAAILLGLDEQPFRYSPVSGAPRSAYCMMGVCFECLVEIDGRPNRQACLTLARDGMEVRRGGQCPATAAQ